MNGQKTLNLPLRLREIKTESDKKDSWEEIGSYYLEDSKGQTLMHDETYYNSSMSLETIKALLELLQGEKKMKLYMVNDLKVGHWFPPQTYRNVAEATRSFELAVNEKGTQFNAHPEDYALYEVAEFNEETGEIKPYSAPISLGLAVTFKKPVASPLQTVQN